MSEEEHLESPVPMPRTKGPVPVPRPRTKLVTTQVQTDEVSTSNESLDRARSTSESDKETPIKPSYRSSSLNRANIRKSLRIVTNNVQERGSAVIENTKAVGARIEKSMRNILKRNSSLSAGEADNTNVSDNMASDNIFNDIKFGSPIVNEDRSLPPPYPPPPLPEDNFYDELSSMRSSPPESHYSYPSSPRKSESYYEEIPFLKKLSLVEGSESDTSSSRASTSLSHCPKSDSWNFFDTSKTKGIETKRSFGLSPEASSSPSTSDSGRPCAEQMEAIHSYENFVPSRVSLPKVSHNVYSELPLVLPHLGLYVSDSMILLHG